MDGKLFVGKGWGTTLVDLSVSPGISSNQLSVELSVVNPAFGRAFRRLISFRSSFPWSNQLSVEHEVGDQILGPFCVAGNFVISGRNVGGRVSGTCSNALDVLVGRLNGVHNHRFSPQITMRCPRWTRSFFDIMSILTHGGLDGLECPR